MLTHEKMDVLTNEQMVVPTNEKWMCLQIKMDVLTNGKWMCQHMKNWCANKWKLITKKWMEQKHEK